nr:hypothetical protein [Streptomyces hygroscopicus]
MTCSTRAHRLTSAPRGRRNGDGERREVPRLPQAGHHRPARGAAAAARGGGARAGAHRHRGDELPLPRRGHHPRGAVGARRPRR